MTRKSVWTVGVFSAMLLIGMSLAASAGDDVIYRGSDLWWTPNDGKTALSFEQDPIPADFFCAGSSAFTGRIVFHGEPLATEPAGVFGNADTIVARLDDAVFDEDGIARTPVQLRALNLVSAEPIETECGRYNVTATLDGVQPITEMRIVRNGTIGGYFFAPLEVNARLSFVPAARKISFRGTLDEPAVNKPLRSYRPLQIVQYFGLGADSEAKWAWTRFPGSDGVEYGEETLVDIDRDGVPETMVQGTTNFATGWLERDGAPGRVGIDLRGAKETTLKARHVAKHSVLPPTTGGDK